MQDRSTLRRGLRHVGSMVAGHPLPFTFAVTGAAVFAAGTVGATVVLGRITDDVVIKSFETGVDPTSDALLGAVAAIAAIAVLRAAGVVTRRFFAAMTSERVQRGFRGDLATHYVRLPMSWHQGTPAGELLAHADSDTTVASHVLHPLPFSVGVTLLVFFSAISLIIVDPPLALVGFLIFPAMGVLNRIYSRKIEDPAARVQASVGWVSTIAHESIDGALVVKTLGRTEAEVERFGEAVGQLRSDRVEVGFLRAGFDAALGALPSIGIVFVIVVGVYRVDAGAVTPGELVQVASLFTVLAFPMRVFGFFLESLPPSLVAHSRIRKVLDLPLAEPPSAGISPAAGPLGVTIDDVSFSYPDGFNVLSNIDVVIAPGEVLAVVGSSGAGKSTLATLIAGLVPVTTGQILLGETVLNNIDPQERSTALAYVFQEPYLFADTIRANIELNREVSASELSRALETAQASDFISEMPSGVDTVVGERGVTLSGGQRQRVALTRALVRRPRLIVLDDATSAVDTVVEQRILDRLRSDFEATMVIVAQRLSTIRLADRVLFLRDGKVAGLDSHASLLSNDHYARLVSAYEEAEA
ncbi:MAG: ABC transporter ATP-binding protein [Acidimicrobiales bacterium]